jgi:hypothetical protein
MQSRRSWLMIAIAALGVGVTSTAFADEGEREDGSVLGSWYIKVQLTVPSGVPDFDATYAFAKGGAFIRIDGRTNAPAVGTWEYRDHHEVVFSAILFNFPGGQVPTQANRNGAIMGVFTAKVDHQGKLNGTFKAFGILGLHNFSRAGTFTGTKIQPDGQFQGSATQ